MDRRDFLKTSSVLSAGILLGLPDIHLDPTPWEEYYKKIKENTERAGYVFHKKAAKFLLREATKYGIEIKVPDLPIYMHTYLEKIDRHDTSFQKKLPKDLKLKSRSKSFTVQSYYFPDRPFDLTGKYVSRKNKNILAIYQVHKKEGYRGWILRGNFISL